MAEGTGLSFWGTLWIQHGGAGGKAAEEASADIVTASGPMRVAAGTSWNKDWATTYGPDANRAKSARKKTVQKALTTLKRAPVIEPISRVQELARLSNVDDVMRDNDDKVVIMLAYYEYLRWRKRRKADDEKAAEILLLW